MVSKRNFIFIGIGIAILVAAIIVYVDSTSMERPWLSMTCEQKIDFAMSPEHQDLTMEQHMEFHKDLQPCVDEMDTNMDMSMVP